MKIGLVLDDTLDTPDGVQQYVLKIGSWLAERGHDVHYLVGHTTRSDLVNVHSLSKNMRVQFNGNRMSMPLPTSRRKLRTFLQAQHFDVLHVQVPYSPFMAGQLLAVAPEHTAIVGTFHILPYSRLSVAANRGLSLLNKRSGKRFDAVIAVSEPAAIFAHKVYGYKTSIIPNPVDLKQFANAYSASKHTTVVFLGRLVPRKGAQYLLQAVAYIKEHNLHTLDFKVIIGGKGAMLAQLQTYAREHALLDIVSFAGFIDEASKADFLAQADIAVYPSIGGESFGIVLLEGMAAARGVVLAGNNPGYSSVMAESDRLFDPKNSAVFAAKLVSWLTDASARSAAAHAHHSYVAQFDIEVVGTKLEKLYKEVLQSHIQS